MGEHTLRITSLQNDQVKDLVRLRNRRDRDRRLLTLIEEPLVIARALAAGYPLATVYFCPENLGPTERDLLRDLRRQAATVVELAPPVMAKVSYRDEPEGLLVVAPQRQHTLDDLAVAAGRTGRPPLLVVLENVEKPGNLGAVLRVADGAGADGVVVCGGGTDLFNPNVLRASRGAFFSVPTVVCAADELFGFLAAQGIAAIATSPAADAPWDSTDLGGPVAILLGAEHDGLSADLLARAERTVGIPMCGSGDSLNVSTSAAILLYEALRQRRSRA